MDLKQSSYSSLTAKGSPWKLALAGTELAGTELVRDGVGSGRSWRDGVGWDGVGVTELAGTELAGTQLAGRSWPVSRGHGYGFP
uniref:Uncharacterized protein n=1 Tax=Globodera rostochiensis TaxID=31243 RepID=A0A914GRU0_GLORO